VTALAAAVGLAIGVATPPRSGPYCTDAACVSYPYTAIVAFFPRDYWWMIPATVMVLSFAVLVACVHQSAAAHRKVYSLSALVFAVGAATMLAADYFIQWTVVQPSLLVGESEGLTLWSMYNPHGVFIAVESLGYLLMGVAFLFLAPVFRSGMAFSRTLRAVFAIGGVLACAALPFLVWRYGVELGYRYEVAAIAIDWLTLILGGALLCLHFGRSETG
jgi:hypothetical protein